MRRSKRKSRPRSSLGCGECSRDFTAEHQNSSRPDGGAGSHFLWSKIGGKRSENSGSHLLPAIFYQPSSSGDPMACGALRTLPENLFPGWPGRMRRRSRWMLWPPQVAPSTTITRSPRQDRQVQQGARTPSSAGLSTTNSVVWAGKKMGGKKWDGFSCQ